MSISSLDRVVWNLSPTICLLDQIYLALSILSRCNVERKGGVEEKKERGERMCV
jgi:hypothetical protein